MLGVHFRGTDMKTQERHPFPATYEQIVSYIDFELLKNKYNKILVTEELNYINKLKKYKSKICFITHRSNEKDIFDTNSRKIRHLIAENIIDANLI